MYWIYIYIYILDILTLLTFMYSIICICLCVRGCLRVGFLSRRKSNRHTKRSLFPWFPLDAQTSRTPSLGHGNQKEAQCGVRVGTPLISIDSWVHGLVPCCYPFHVVEPTTLIICALCFLGGSRLFQFRVEHLALGLEGAVLLVGKVAQRAGEILGSRAAW